VGLFAEYLALGGADNDVYVSLGLFAFAGWGVLLFEVFYAVRSADRSTAE
jgi:hypothetical protein